MPDRIDPCPHPVWCSALCDPSERDVAHREVPDPPLLPSQEPSSWVSLSACRCDELTTAGWTLAAPEVELSVAGSVAPLTPLEAIELGRRLVARGEALLGEVAA